VAHGDEARMSGLLPPAIAFLLGDIGDFKLKMDEAQAKAAETDGKIAGAGKLGAGAFLAVGAAIGGVAYESLKLATTFDQTMTRINTQDNAGLTIKQMKDLKNSVLDLGGQVAQTPEALAEAMIHVYGSGLQGAKALDLLRVAAEGATVGHANLTDVTNALDAAVAVGIKGTGDYKDAMGQLNATVGAGDMTMQNLADALGGPMLATVKGYGLSITDVGAGLAVFGDRNIRGAEAATNLRMAAQALEVPAKGGAKALASLGLTANSLADDLQKGGLKLALNDLNDHLKAAGYNSTNSGQLITEAFGKKAGGGLGVLMDSLSSSTSNFNDKFKLVAESGKTFGADWAMTQDTLAFKIHALGAEVEGMGVKVGTWLIPKVSEFVGFVQRDVVPELEHFATSVHNALASPAAREAEGILAAVFKDVAAFLKDSATAAVNFGRAVAPVAGLLAGAFFVALSAAGSILKNDIGPALVAVSGFMREHAAVIKVLAEVALAGLIARLLYLKTLAAFDMFASFVGGIGKAVAAYRGFVTSVATGQIFDTIRLKAMYAADSVKGLTVATTESSVAAEANVGARGFGGFVKGLGNSLPIIGAVALAGYGLYKMFGHIGVAANDTTTQITGLTNAMLDMSNGLDTSDGRMRDMIMTAQHFGGTLEHQLVEPIDRSLAQLVSSGHIQQAKDAIAALDNQVTAAGGSADRFNNQLSQYTDATKAWALQQREAALKTGDSTAAVDANTSSMGAGTSSAQVFSQTLQNVTQSQQDMAAGLNASRALDDFQTQIDNVSKALTDNGVALSGNTAAARNNRDAVRSAMQVIIDNYNAQTQSTGPTQAATDKFKAQVDQLVQNSAQTDDARKKVRDFIDTLNVIPKDIPPIKVTVDTSGGLQKLNELGDVIANLGGSLATAIVTKNVRQHYAAGGFVTGPGGPTSDSVAAMLSAGEYVIDAAGVSRVPRALLDALNTGNVDLARSILGAGQGGAGTPSIAGGSSGAGDTVVNVYVQDPGSGAWRQASNTRTEVLRYNQRNSRPNMSLPGYGR
jgi:TP901 family phage tail tape measure protein